MISLFSCSPEQYSYEVEALEQGAFTYALLEGLGIRGRCATVERLNQYLEHRVPKLVTQYLGRVRQVPYTIAEPLNRSHLILMRQNASLADIAALKNDAYRAERDQDWDLTATLDTGQCSSFGSGYGCDQSPAKSGNSTSHRTAPPQSEPPRTAESSKASSNPTTPVKKDTTQRSTPTTLTNSASTASPSSVPVPKSQSPSQASPVSITASPPLSTAESRSLTRRQVLASAISAGVGVVGVTIASQLTKVPSQPTSPSTNVDYSELERFLRARKWEEADRETVNLMLKVVNREKERWLNRESIKNFPCDVLSKIDRLWVDNSGGSSPKTLIWCGVRASF